MTVEIPSRMRALPLDKHHRPIPWFAYIKDGVPDHRVIKPGALHDAIRFKKCWVCGGPMGKFGTFVIGPMCAVNRVSAEPPSHGECADYSARACPFLTTPNMERRRGDKPEGWEDPAGIMLERNPGVTLVWNSSNWKAFAVSPEMGGGTLFDIGDPLKVEWHCEGRPATRDECMASIDSGLPTLEAEVAKDGPAAKRMYEVMVARARKLVPA